MCAGGIEDMNGCEPCVCIGGTEVTVLPILLVLSDSVVLDSLIKGNFENSSTKNAKVVQTEIKYLHPL